MDNDSANPMDNQTALSEINKLKVKLQSARLPANLLQKANEQIERINITIKYGGNFSHLDIIDKYINWIISLPWATATKDQIDLAVATAILEKNHFGLQRVKRRVLEYLSILSLQQQKNTAQVVHARPILFVGLAGTGKTTFAYSVAQTLGRKIARIPFGGLSSARDLRGQSKTSPESEPGLIIKALRQEHVKNPVILLDELDRITPESRASIMGVLLEILDPAQNLHYTDYFIDYPFDLSGVLFIGTANNTSNIAPAVLDRLELIQMPSYSDEEKTEIGKNYILPKYIQLSGLTPDQIVVEDSLWTHLVRPLGFEPGIRSLERLIEEMVRKVAFQIVSKEGTKFYINENNYKEYTV